MDFWRSETRHFWFCNCSTGSLNAGWGGRNGQGDGIPIHIFMVRRIYSYLTLSFITLSPYFVVVVCLSRIRLAEFMYSFEGVEHLYTRWPRAESHYNIYDHFAVGYVSHAHCILLLYSVGNKITTITTNPTTRRISWWAGKTLADYPETGMQVWFGKFNGLLGTAYIWVHVVHTSRLIITYTLESLSSLT